MQIVGDSATIRWTTFDSWNRHGLTAQLKSTRGCGAPKKRSVPRRLPRCPMKTGYIYFFYCYVVFTSIVYY